MANLGSIQTAWLISLLFGAGMGSVLVLRWVWERINLWSELAAMVISLVVAPLLLFAMGTDADTEWVRLGIMALTTTTIAIAITFVTPRTDDRTLLAFYQRVRPFGWWPRAARLRGDRPTTQLIALGRRPGVVALTAASLFLLLTGAGRLLVSPAGASAELTWAVVGGGLALIPLWWREVGRDR